ncbi:DUF1648 domain-containing protein [Granulicoccus sp. GXG6511]|uniref:DUF1648 domain-containing protein n=1 Tax=Granulicoccus sp. GXG6511 TaxID=3381351 RepID=UPI003D7E6B1A
MSATRILFGLWLMAVAGFVILWVWALLTMPDRVPVHTDWTGTATRWGSRWELLGVLGGAALLTVALPVWLGGWIRRGGSLTHVNVPHKKWWLETREREQELRDKLAADMLVISLLTVVLFLGVLAGALAQATAETAEAPAWSAWTMWATLGALIVYAVIAGTMRYRPTR